MCDKSNALGAYLERHKINLYLSSNIYFSSKLFHINLMNFNGSTENLYFFL